MRGFTMVIPLIAVIQAHADDSAANHIWYEHESMERLPHRSVHAWADALADRMIRTPVLHSGALDDVALAKTTSGGSHAASLGFFRAMPGLAARPFSQLAPYYKHAGPRLILSAPRYTSPDLRSSIISHSQTWPPGPGYHTDAVVKFEGEKGKLAAQNALSSNGTMIGDEFIRVEPWEGKKQLHLPRILTTTSDEAIKEAFSQYGEVAWVNVLRDKTAQGRVRFGGPNRTEAAESALALNGTLFVANKSGRREIIVELSNFGPATVLIKGLPHKANSNEVKAHFSKYGTVKSAVVTRGKDKGRERGRENLRATGRIRFEGADGPEAAKRSLALNGTLLEEKVLVVEQSKDKPERVVVKGLPLHINVKGLKELFTPYGTVQFANVRRKPSRDSESA